MSLTPNKKQKIKQKNDLACQGCGSVANLTIDHIIPRAQGGTDDESNLTVLCGQCNLTKGFHLPQAPLWTRIKYALGVRKDMQTMELSVKNLHRAANNRITSVDKKVQQLNKHVNNYRKQDKKLVTEHVNEQMRKASELIKERDEAIHFLWEVVQGLAVRIEDLEHGDR